MQDRRGGARECVSVPEPFPASEWKAVYLTAISEPERYTELTFTWANLRVCLAHNFDDFTDTLQDVSDHIADGMMKSADLAPSLTEELQKSIGRKIINQRDHSDATRAGRGNSKTTSPKLVAFYSVLLCVGGPRTLGLVTKALGGPSAEVEAFARGAPPPL